MRHIIRLGSIKDLLANKEARAVLAGIAGEELLNHPMLVMVEDLPLENLAEMFTDFITEDIARGVNAALIKVKK